MTTRSIQGMDKLEKKLKMLANPHKPIVKGMKNYQGFLEKKIEPYPPESQANRKPGINGYSWYDRGFGTRTITGKVYKTSQKMNTKWKYAVKKVAAGVRMTIKNLADYSGFVQGEKQTWYHAMRKWPRVDNIIDSTSKQGLRFIQKEIHRELNK